MRLAWLAFAMLVQPGLLGCTGGRTEAEPPAPVVAPRPPSSEPVRTVFGAPLPDPFGCQGEDCFSPHGPGGPAEIVRPQRLSGGELRLPPEAIAQGVHGVVLARCLVTVEGVLKDCRILKSPPRVDAAVLDYLRRGRYSPITYNGKPVAAHYVFNLRIQPAPQRAEDPGSAKVRK